MFNSRGKVLFLLTLFLLITLPTVSALCIPFLQDCSQNIILIDRGSNEDVNFSWLDTMEFAFEQPARNVDVEIIGAEIIISSSSSISSGSPINIGTGISKLKLEVLSGVDTTGDITINAVKHDRDTGVTTEPFSETLALAGVADTNMTSEWIGNKTASDDINLTTTNFDGVLELIQWSFYQNAENDFNIIRISVTIETADTAAAKSFDFNFFKIAGDGNVTTLVTYNDIDFAPNGIARNRIYRLDRNCIDDECFIDVTSDGIHAAFDQQSIDTVEVIITYEFTRQLQVSGVAGNNVTRLIAGSNITLDPSTGIGDVTVSSTGGGGAGGFYFPGASLTLSDGNFFQVNDANLALTFYTQTDANSNFVFSSIYNAGFPIVDGNLSESYVLANGTRPLTANWSAGGFDINSGSFTTDLISGGSNDTTLLDGNITLGKNYLKFPINVGSPVNEEGVLSWNQDDGTLNIDMPGGEVRLQVGQEMLLRARNETGFTITNGSVVFVNGASGSRPTVALADATDHSSSNATIAVATEDCPDNQNCFFNAFGLVRDINTVSFNVGDAVFLSTTPGEFTRPPPTSPDSSVFVGVILRSHATEGILFVKIISLPNLEELSNVLITSLSDRDILQYVIDQNAWINSSDLNLLGNVKAFDVNADSFCLSGSCINDWADVNQGISQADGNALYVKLNPLANQTISGFDLTIGQGFFWDNDTNRLALVNAENEVTINGTDFGIGLTVHQNDGNINIGAHTHSDTPSSSAVFECERSRGTEESEAAIQDGDTACRLSSLGYDGTDYLRMAELRITTATGVGSNSMPGIIELRTTPVGGVNPVTHVTLDENGVTTFEQTILGVSDINSGNDIYASQEITVGSAKDLTTEDVWIFWGNTQGEQFRWDESEQSFVISDDFRTVDDLLVDGGDIGITADPNLLGLASNRLTIRGDATLDSTGGTTDITIEGTEVIRQDGTSSYFGDVAGNSQQAIIRTNGANRIIVDTGGDVRVLNTLGVGLARTDGTVHVHTGSSGTVNASGNADDLVVENSATAGISILSPDNVASRLYLGSPTNNSAGRITWQHSTLLFQIGSVIANGTVQINSGNGVTAITIDELQNTDFAANVQVDKNFHVDGFRGTPDQGTLTVAGGVIQVTGSLHSVTPEGGDTTDIVTDVNGGASGDLLFLTAPSGKTITFKDNAGGINSIFTHTTSDVNIGGSWDTAFFIRKGTRWELMSVMSRSQLHVDGVGILNLRGNEIQNDGRTWVTIDASENSTFTGTISGGRNIFSAYTNANSVTFTTATPDLNFDVEIRDDSRYTHSTVTDNHEVTINTTGDYLVSFDCSVDVSSGSARSTARCYLTNNGSEIDGTRCFTYNRTTGNGDATCSMNRLVTLTSGNVITVQVARHTGSDTLIATADGSRLTMEWAG